jgi:D-lactate dehydrogenase
MAQAATNVQFAPASAHEALAEALASTFPAHRLIRDPLRKLAYGTDASFYRLIPQIVVVVESEAEMEALLRQCRMFGTPVTFRAAGTSLSGQAVTDSVLAVLGDGWNGVEIGADRETIRLKPGVLGAEANRRLAPFGRKIGPDPASINACKIGGIAANNASGMCCGTSQNSYRTLISMRLMLADGTLLDSGDAASRAAFRIARADLVEGLAALAERTRADEALAGRIRRKFAIKNTCGYSLNALVDFIDPIDILQHLMIGSEGTLGFISEITYRTVPEHADKASALMLFASVVDACEAVIRLKRTPVAAVELMDRASLRSVEDKPGMPAFIRTLPGGATALLVETRGESAEALAANIAKITEAMEGVSALFPISFTDQPAEYETLWNIRKGLFPSAAAMRESGTAVIIEDVAFPIERLAAATADVQRLLIEHGYGGSFIFGHALEGNLHFVITPDLGRADEVARYARFMDALSQLVVDRYDGALKAEHGTGRNVAPFVEHEWGRQAYALMRELKRLFDPDGLLNPGVILNDDHEIHLKNIKPMAPADPLVDSCMECGFCERMCPSEGLTLTPRQRIVGWREISRLGQAGRAGERAELESLYAYQGLDTCAACGLCATACPVGIETGLLTKKIRGERQSPVARRAAGWIAGHYGTALTAAKQGLRAGSLAERALGPETMESVTRTLRRLSGDRLPVWTKAMPTAVNFRPKPPSRTAANGGGRPEVVYLPSCVARTMGPARSDPERESLPEKTQGLLEKAGYAVVYPEGLAGLCCGQPFDSGGLAEPARAKADEVARALAAASRDGELPIVSDTSPCSYRLKQALPEHLRPADIVEFIHDRLMDRLAFERRPGAVALHVTCSGRKMGLEGKLKAIGSACAETAVIPVSVGCCGWAGDKGFTTPELNAHALRTLKAELPQGCEAGYSHSRTCEIGLSVHAEMPYRSIVYLVDACTKAPVEA